MSAGTEKNGIQVIHEYDIDIDNYLIYLMGREEHPNDDYEEPGVEYRLSNRLVRNLNYLSFKDENLHRSEWRGSISLFLLKKSKKTAHSLTTR